MSRNFMFILLSHVVTSTTDSYCTVSYTLILSLVIRPQGQKPCFGVFSIGNFRAVTFDWVSHGLRCRQTDKKSEQTNKQSNQLPNRPFWEPKSSSAGQNISLHITEPRRYLRCSERPNTCPYFMPVDVIHL